MHNLFLQPQIKKKKKTICTHLKLIDEYLIEKVGVGSGSFPLGSPSSDRRRTVQIVTRWISVVRFGTIASAPTARHHLQPTHVYTQVQLFLSIRSIFLDRKN
jgi:hypothetical protein